MFCVTLTPTMTSASTKINVIPSRAQVRVDCRVPPGLGEDGGAARIAQVLGLHGDGTDQLAIEFTERVIGNQSPTESPLMSAITRWIEAHDPGASTVPLILQGFSDSKWFRDAFPECTAYGFFPMRHQSLLEATPLMHNADERIDVRDLGFATDCYFDLIARAARLAARKTPPHRLQLLSTAVSTRLDPDIFRLPVDRIREGYYSDAYFVLTKPLLEAEGEHPHVTDAGLPEARLDPRRDRRGDRDPQDLRRALGATASGSTAGISWSCTRCTRATRSPRARR